ncbi:MAG: AmmeMemoRadiSam system protein B [Calditrichaeota bacterium]|nr:AmmeMemoRadiSam system protein B [Calditrichota bacterium]
MMGNEAIKIRKPAWAGQFYPAHPQQLKEQIREFLDAAPSLQIAGKILGVIVPHAGYVYSGPTAAIAYKQMAGLDIKTVVVIAPSHAVAFSGASIYDGDYYETPLGKIKIDKALSASLAEETPRIRLSSTGHDFKARQPEHSLEVQLPFLQQVIANTFELVAIVFHDYTWENCRALGEAIAKVMTPDKTILVASSDLYHGYSYDECIATDDRTLNAITAFDSENFCRGANTLEYQACGAGPVTAMMVAAQKWGADRIELLGRTNSADVTGTKGGWTVGYAAMAVIQTNIK